MTNAKQDETGKALVCDICNHGKATQAFGQLVFCQHCSPFVTEPDRALAQAVKAAESGDSSHLAKLHWEYREQANGERCLVFEPSETQRAALRAEALRALSGLAPLLDGAGVELSAGVYGSGSPLACALGLPYGYKRVATMTDEQIVKAYPDLMKEPGPELLAVVEQEQLQASFVLGALRLFES